MTTAEEGRRQVARPDPMLSASGLGRTFGGFRAVDDVSFDVYPGRVLGLIGANGAGKTTVLNMISGVLRSTDGTVRIEGRDVTRTSARWRARAGVLRTFQHPRLVGDLTAIENVMVGAGMRERRAGRRQSERALYAAAVEALGRTGLDQSVWATRAEQIPPVQHRWIEVARVVAADPKVAIFDEPTSGFPQSDTARLRELLAWLAKENGVGVVLVSHDVKLAADLSDELVVMNRGAVLARGSSEDVLSQEMVMVSYLGRRTAERLGVLRVAKPTESVETHERSESRHG